LGGLGGVYREGEGLDARGEAPPPYSNDKPPSIRAAHISSDEGGCGIPEESQRLELRPMCGRGYELPRYDESLRLEEDDAACIARPHTAVIAPERYGSMGRLLSNTESSSQA